MNVYRMKQDLNFLQGHVGFGQENLQARLAECQVGVGFKNSSISNFTTVL